MQSLTGKMSRERLAAGAPGGNIPRPGPAAGAATGIVLPRLLRKPFRHLLRLFNHGILFSPKVMATAAILFVGTSGAAGVVASGQAGEWIAKATAIAGIRIGDIEIEGTNEVSRIDILTSIDLGPQRSLISFDVHRARDDLKRLAWVRDATVTKAYPDKLLVRIVERQPFAVWQNGQALFLVERDGTEIAPFDPRHAGLPLVVGKGANRHAAELIAAVARHKEIAARVTAYVRLGDRRWDLKLDNGAVASLPETDFAGGIETLARLQAENSILERAVETIDLRLADRTVIRLSSDAAAARKETVGQRIERAKRLEKRI